MKNTEEKNGTIVSGSEEFIEVFGAREHNLKNIDIAIPKNKLVVITGISGSGKSSLAFDTIYAEGQRRYMETFGAYARQFIGEMERPDVDKITGLSPVISIEQKTTNKNPRSTVGTVTEVYDFLRLLFARASEAYSYNTGKKMVKWSEDEIVNNILKRFDGNKITILAPLVRGRKGHYRELFEEVRKKGFLKVRIDGEVKDITPKMQLDRYKIHNIELVVDRLKVSTDLRTRISQSVQQALKLGKDLMFVASAAESPTLTLPNREGTANAQDPLKENTDNNIDTPNKPGLSAGEAPSIGGGWGEAQGLSNGKVSPIGGDLEGAGAAVLGITGTGGAGKSSVTDEIVRRYLNTFSEKTIAVISVDPSKKKTGGALLGDRIRMNSISSSRAYMRSLATRESDKALSQYVQEAIDICKAAGFDLIILESAGVGQSDASILDYCDVSLYIMTPEYGAASQLEKINMLDYADIVAINKFDKAGALDALHDVRKQYKRNHGLWTAKDEALPIIGTIAAQFNDAGVNQLFEEILQVVEKKTGITFGDFKASPTGGGLAGASIIPPKRVRLHRQTFG